MDEEDLMQTGFGWASSVLECLVVRGSRVIRELSVRDKVEELPVGL